MASTYNDSHCANIAEGEAIEFYIFLVITPDILFSIGNLILTFVLYRTVEISHPQFGIIFQNHCFGNVVNTLSLILHCFNFIIRIPCFTTIFYLLNYNALHFHFTSWLSVAIMRLYFIIEDPATEEFPKIKNHAFAFVWIFFIGLKVCNNIALQLCTVLVTRIVFHSLTLLPIVLCILIYVALKIILAKFEQLELTQHKYRMEESPPQNEHEIDLEEVSFIKLSFENSNSYSSEWVWKDQIQVQDLQLICFGQHWNQYHRHVLTPFLHFVVRLYTT